MNVVLMLIGLTSLGLVASPVGAAQPTSASPDCRSEGDLSFVCGPRKPEDLAVLPGTDWLIASGMEEGGGLHLIDTRTRMWRRWIAARPVKPDPRFPDCDSPEGAAVSDTRWNVGDVLYVPAGTDVPSEEATQGPPRAVFIELK
jgi:hypothetical protein